MPVFNEPVQITGPNNQVLELTCTNGRPSHVELLAVNSNDQLEGQIRFLGQFSLTGVPNTPSNPDGNGSGMTYYVPSGLLKLFNPQHVPGIDLDPALGQIRIADKNGHGQIVLDSIAGNVTIKGVAIGPEVVQQVNNLQQQIGANQQQIAALHQQIAALQLQINNLQQQLTSLQQKEAADVQTLAQNIIALEQAEQGEG